MSALLPDNVTSELVAEAMVHVDRVDRRIRVNEFPKLYGLNERPFASDRIFHRSCFTAEAWFRMYEHLYTLVKNGCEAWIDSKITRLKELLDEIPEQNVIDRIRLESRLKKLEEDKEAKPWKRVDGPHEIESSCLKIFPRDEEAEPC